MTTREFDPVLSAALRNELEALADGRPAPVAPRRRLQWVVTAATAVLLLLATAGVLRLTSPQVFQPAAPRPGVVDQLKSIQDPADVHYIRQRPRVLLRVNGTGPGSWTFAAPEGVTEVRPYVSCAPSGAFEVGIDGPSGVQTDCDRTGPGGYADKPVTAGRHTVQLDVPEGTEFSLLLIATPVYTPSTEGPALPTLPWPKTVPGLLLAEERGDHRIATGVLPGTHRGVVITVTCKGTGSVTVSTSFGDVGDPAAYGNCGPNAVKRWNTGVSGPDPVEDAAYTITPYGDVAWTVTFTTDDEGTTTSSTLRVTTAPTP